MAVALTLGTTVAQAADPFYTRLLREGTDAYNRKEYATAERKLRLACFGFLDEPDLLADGLTRLALAQAADGNTAGFDKTFERIVEVEERFQGYSHAATPPEVRAQFERLVVKLIPAATLAERPTFARLLQAPGDGLASTPVAQRRKDLERLVKTEPTVARWPLMLADLDLSQGDAESAEAAATAALKLEPGNRQALRLRGIALAAERRWVPALDDLAACGAVGTDQAATEADLRALVELARFQEASDLYAKLPQPLATEKAIQQLGGVAAVGLAQARSTPTPPPPPATPTSPPPVETPTAPPPPPTQTATELPPTPTAPPPTQAVAPAPTAPPTATPAVPPLPTQPPTPVPPAGQAAGLATPVPSPTVVESALTTPPEVATPAPGGSEATSAAAAQAELDAIKQLERQNQFREALVRAKRLADAHPEFQEAQFLVGQLAYLTLRWSEAVTYFRRGGDPGDKRPLLLFYEAISLYESGDRQGAAGLLRRALPKIQHTRYVKDYTQKILGPGAQATPAPSAPRP